MSMLSWLPPKFGCVGLCPGDRCERCARLAEAIHTAKGRARGAERDARLLVLAGLVGRVMGVRHG